MQNTHGNGRPSSWLSLLVTAGALLTVGACAGIRVKAEQHVPDFDQFRTYAWPTERSPARGPRDEGLAASIKNRVDLDLAARGLREASQSDADLLVREEAQIESKIVFVDPYYAVFYTAKRYEDGILTVTLLDSHSNTAVWHGTARHRLRTASQGYGLFRLIWVDTTEERDRNVPEMVDAIFERFPIAEASSSAPES